MYIPGPFDNFARFLWTMPARILLGPFLILYIVFFGKLTLLGIVLPHIQGSFGLWFFTLPVRAIIGPVLGILLLFIGNLTTPD